MADRSKIIAKMYELGLFKDPPAHGDAASQASGRAGGSSQADWGAANQRIVDEAKALLDNQRMSDNPVRDNPDRARELQEADDYRFALQLQHEEQAGLPPPDPSRRSGASTRPVQTDVRPPTLWTMRRSTGSRDPTKFRKRDHQQAADRFKDVLVMTGGCKPPDVSTAAAWDEPESSRYCAGRRWNSGSRTRSGVVHIPERESTLHYRVRNVSDVRTRPEHRRGEHVAIHKACGDSRERHLLSARSCQPQPRHRQRQPAHLATGRRMVGALR